MDDKNNSTIDEETKKAQVTCEEINTDDQTNDNPLPSAKKGPPKVSPSTIVMTCIFALLFTIGVSFYPYLEALLPVGGTTLQGSFNVLPISHEQLIKKATFVVIGKVTNKAKAQQDDSIKTNDGLGFLMYKEVTIDVIEVLYGEPYMENNKLITFELGGSALISDGPQKKKINVNYADAAILNLNSTVLLFLDDSYNIINEKYGLYQKHNDAYYYNCNQEMYAIDDIRSALKNKDNTD